MNPCVSVIMSAYNEPESYIRDSIDSILKQTLDSFEFIIVNDNPARLELSNLLHEYAKADSRILVINNEINLGLTASLNKALQFVKAPYVARMDADDVAYFSRLQKQYSFLQSYSDIDICGSCVEIINKEGVSIGFYSYPLKSGQIKAKMFFRDCICHPSVIMRTDKIKELGGYNNDFKKSQDYELWIRSIFSELNFSNIDLPLLKYRVHGENISYQYSGEQADFAKKCKIKLYSFYLNMDSAEDIYSILNEQFHLGQFLKGLPKLIRMIKRVVVMNYDVSLFYMILIMIKRVTHLIYQRVFNMISR